MYVEYDNKYLGERVLNTLENIEKKVEVTHTNMINS